MNDRFTLHHGDCLEILKTIPDNLVDSIVTDPPYGLSFMGKKWDYDVPSKDIWVECLRVLKPGGHLLAFAGTRTQHRMAVNIEDAGFEIRDMIAWVYGSGFPKSHNLQGEHKGFGTALKPALEPITMARKPFKDTVADNVMEWGTGAINVDGCRIGNETRTMQGMSRYLESRPWSDLQKKGERKRPISIVTGRWPANLIHDGSEEVLAVFPDCSGKVGMTKHGSGTNTKYGKFNRSDKSLIIDGVKDSGSAARFFYVPKASKKDRDEGCEGMDEREAGIKNDSGRGFSESDPHAKIMRRNFHPTVKPTDLMAYLCRLVTPPNGLVLDPFMGSGSTGKAAIREGFNFIGIERDAEYIAIAENRIQFELDKQSEMLFPLEAKAL